MWEVVGGVQVINPLTPQAVSNTTSGVLAKGTVDRSFNYNPSIEVVVSGATAKDGAEIAKAIDDRLKESLSKMSVQAMARTSVHNTIKFLKETQWLY